jgi:hypothetical protein
MVFLESSASQSTVQWIYHFSWILNGRKSAFRKCREGQKTSSSTLIPVSLFNISQSSHQTPSSSSELLGLLLLWPVSELPWWKHSRQLMVELEVRIENFVCCVKNDEQEVVEGPEQRGEVDEALLTARECKRGNKAKSRLRPRAQTALTFTTTSLFCFAVS